MTLSLSDTPATVTDSVAGVKILQEYAANDSAYADSAVTEYEAIEADSPMDVLDSVWADCYDNDTINLLSAINDTSAVTTQGVRGVYGIPAVSDVTRNDIVSSLVLVCFFVTVTIFSVARDYISRQTKRFFGKISKSRGFTGETINEVKLNIYFTIQTCLIFSIITYILFSHTDGASEAEMPLILIIPAASAAFTAYFAIKYILYMIADSVFYDDKKIKRQHTDDLCYIMTVQGLLLFPSLLISISKGIDMQSLAIYVTIVIVFAKLLAFYKTICTFSGHYTTFLQIILYFCALEMIPLMSLCGILAMTAKYL